MARESAQRDTGKIIAAVILPHHKVLAGNVFVIEAQNEEEQKKIMTDMAKTVKGDVARTSNGIYLIIKD